MARYDYIPHGYKVIGEHLVNIETNKVWNSDKTIDEREGKRSVQETKPAPASTDAVAENETVTVPAVSATKTRKKINKG